jgi:DNA-directed RNA polymerase specialized sigma24 family protein
MVARRRELAARAALAESLNDELRAREIGAQLGISIATVGTRLRRARHKLRGVLCASHEVVERPCSAT